MIFKKFLLFLLNISLKVFVYSIYVVVCSFLSINTENQNTLPNFNFLQINLQFQTARNHVAHDRKMWD